MNDNNDLARPADRALASQAPTGLQPPAFDPSRGKEVLGIECEHHYGITTHASPLDGDIISAVYRLLRNWHPTLADDDHTWGNESRNGWSRIVIRKNEKSPRFAFNPYGAPDGPGALWFDLRYRIATRETIQNELADKLAQAQRLRDEAMRERPTKIGTKRAHKKWGYAETSEREAELIARRWPSFCGLARTGWQTRMHEHRQPAIATETREGGNAAGGAVHEGADPQGIAQEPHP